MIMNKIIYFVILAIVLVSCNQSNEQKAESLVKETMKKNLVKPDTYEPIETKVDSAFAPYDDPKMYEILEKVGLLSYDIDQLKMKIRMAESSMDIWGSDKYSPNYKHAKEDYEEAIEKMESLQKKFEKYGTEARAIVEGGRKFAGFKVTHSYRASNNAGNTIVDELVFFLNKDLSEVVTKIKLDDYKRIQLEMENW